MKPAVFLDRDGVLVKNIDGDYIRERSQIELLPFAEQAVNKLYKNGFEVVIVTNQACVNKKLISIDDALAIQEEIKSLVDPLGVLKLKSELCPHTSDERCECRKPRPGMIFEAQKKYNLDLSKSYMIGDALSDIEAAKAANVSPILVLSGRGRSSDLVGLDGRVEIFDHIGRAVDYICGDAR